jgi:hypothetical protein
LNQLSAARIAPADSALHAAASKPGHAVERCAMNHPYPDAALNVFARAKIRTNGDSVTLARARDPGLFAVFVSIFKCAQNDDFQHRSPSESPSQARQANGESR